MADQKQTSLFNSILKAGFVAGTIDITCAFIHFYISTGKNPMVILPYIASAVFGKEAFTGGNLFVVYGLLFHYAIAFGWTILFFYLYPRIAFLRKNIFLTASLYGLFVWVMMNRVVVPMTTITQKGFDLKNAIIACLILIVAIGFPLSFFAKRFYRNK